MAVVSDLSRGVPDNGQACASSEELVGVESAVAGSRCRFQIDAGRAIDDPYLFRAESAVVRHTFSNANSTSGDWGSPGSLMQVHCRKPSWLFPQPNIEKTTVSNLEVLELIASSNTGFADNFAGWSTRVHIQSFSSCRVAWRIYSRGEVERTRTLAAATLAGSGRSVGIRRAVFCSRWEFPIPAACRCDIVVWANCQRHHARSASS